MTTDPDKEVLRRDRGALVEALLATGRAMVNGNVVKCPFHEDRHPSGSIHQRDDGAWAFKCHGCGVNEDVYGVRKLAGDSRPLPSVGRRDADAPKAAKVYPTIQALAESMAFVGKPDGGPFVYSHPDTRIAEMVVLRLRQPNGDKTFLQASPAQGGGYKLQAPPKPWPLYNRARVRGAERVIVVEGEKCVHALHDCGIVATTSPGGAKNGHHADWRPLAGKWVALWPDFDASGDGHMRFVAAELAKLDPPSNVHWIDPELLSLPPGGDVVDFLAQYGGESPADRRKAVECLYDVAEPMGVERELEKYLEDAIAGRRKAVPWPWPTIGRLSKALMPGTVTCVCGDPDSTKSMFLIEAAAYWHRNGQKVAIYELEDDRAFHMSRVLAQLEDNSLLHDDEWPEHNADATRAAYARHREFFASFGRSLYVSPDDQVTLDDLARWVRERCEAGARIIVIDPITFAATSDKPWLDDLRFLVAAKSAVRRHGASLILVTHPRKGNKNSKGLSDLAGGAAYPRFSHTVLWIEAHVKRIPVRIAGQHGDFGSSVNRTVRIRKARNGRGGGLSIGYDFDGATLRFSEQGVIIEADQTRADVVPQAEPRRKLVTPRATPDPFGDD